MVDVPERTVSPEMSQAAWLSMGARRWVQAEEGSRTSRLALSLVEDKTTKEKSVQAKDENCGTVRVVSQRATTVPKGMGDQSQAPSRSELAQ